ncbi:LamB/YcsF family protein [Dactylosporangium sp. CA-139066]|uniref:LamB/YcsF family protein n=1 Tax=Dactylosporangium sp. CA-139066 TaxID=3239930 RepID=UPI003D92C214
MVDLNSDLGEGFGVWCLGDDEALLAIVTSANVACGFHAGDPSTMRRVSAQAAALGVRVGAQVSYRDLAGFGRRRIDVPPDELADELRYQIGALAAFGPVAYVKPHGALYNTAAVDEAHASAVVEAAASFTPTAGPLGGALTPGTATPFGTSRTPVASAGLPPPATPATTAAPGAAATPATAATPGIAATPSTAATASGFAAAEHGRGVESGVGLPVLCQPGSVLARLAVERGLRVVAEGFVDRGYLPDGRLVPRSRPGALVTDVGQVTERAIRMAVEGVVEAIDGTVISMPVESLCVHGDTPGAVGMARAVREGLLAAGVAVRPFA